MTSDQEGTRKVWYSQPFAVLMAAISIGFAITVVVLPLQQLTQDFASATVQIDSTDATAALSQLPQVPRGASISPTDSDGLTVTLTAVTNADGQPVSAGLRLLSEAGTSLWAASLAVIFALLAGTLSRIGNAQPFARRNAESLVIIAAAIVIGSIGADSLNWLNAQLIYDFVGARPPISVTPYYSLLPILLAALALVLASAFRRGQRIEEDIEGLI